MSGAAPAAKRPWYYPVLAAPLLAMAWLPLPLLYGLAGFIYLLLAYVVRYRRRVVRDNLRHAFPDLSQPDIERTARQFYWHFAQVLVEIVKLAAIGPRQLQRRMRWTNLELAAPLLAQGRTLLVLGSHLGNWEWILASAGVLFPGQVAGVYKPLGSPFFEWYMRRARTRLGPAAVPMAQVLRYMVQHRGQGQELSLLLDQAAGPDDRPYWTDFLHREAGFYTSADRLAPQFQAAVLYVGIRRERLGHYALHLAELPPGPAPGLPPTTPDAARYPATEAFVRHLEADIRATPAQYLWTHRRWKHKR